MIRVDTGPGGLYHVTFHAIERWRLRFKSNSPLESDEEIAEWLVGKLRGAMRVGEEHYARRFMVIVCVDRVIITVMWAGSPKTRQFLALAKEKRKQKKNMKLKDLNGRYLMTADWCGPCKMLKARLPADTDITLVDVDVEMALAKELNIKGVPALVVIENGVVKERYVGAEAGNHV